VIGSVRGDRRNAGRGAAPFAYELLARERLAIIAPGKSRLALNNVDQSRPDMRRSIDGCNSFAALAISQ
jgi:hypothetical protein